MKATFTEYVLFAVLVATAVILWLLLLKEVF